MWIRLTDEELIDARRKKRRGRLNGSIIFGVFTMGTFLFKFGKLELLSGQSNGLLFVPWGQISSRFLGSLGIGFLAGLLVYLLMPKRTVLVCPKCGTTKYKSEDESLECKCGSQFENLEGVKWVDH
jgi:hypothetical protein